MACTDSDYLPARWNLPSAVSGDTFPGTGAITFLVNDEAPSSPLASVVMAFPGLVLSSEDDSLIIDDATSWTFHIPAFEITLAAGVHTYALVTTAENGDVRTYLTGSWKIA